MTETTQKLQPTAQTTDDPLGFGRFVYRRSPDGSAVRVKISGGDNQREIEPRLSSDYVHVCHSFDDPDIPHLVKSGPDKGKRGFQSKREVDEWRARKNGEDGMNLQFRPD